MHPLLFKILVLIPMLALLGILTYKKINEGFIITTPNTTTSQSVTQTTMPLTISTQLTNEIAKKLGVSVRRIQDVAYSGDMANLTLSVSFTILEPNLIESANREPNATKAGQAAKSLFVSNQFNVSINNTNMRLTRINNTDTGSAPKLNTADFFNNKGLLDTAAYAQQVYNAVPVDSAATRFFKLETDSNFNIVPVLPTIAPITN
jgi:hypothetical protein